MHTASITPAAHAGPAIERTTSDVDASSFADVLSRSTAATPLSTSAAPSGPASRPESTAASKPSSAADENSGAQPERADAEPLFTAKRAALEGGGDHAADAGDTAESPEAQSLAEWIAGLALLPPVPPADNTTVMLPPSSTAAAPAMLATAAAEGTQAPYLAAAAGNARPAAAAARTVAASHADAGLAPAAAPGAGTQAGPLDFLPRATHAERAADAAPPRGSDARAPLAAAAAELRAPPPTTMPGAAEAAAALLLDRGSSRPVAPAAALPDIGRLAAALAPPGVAAAQPDVLAGGTEVPSMPLSPPVGSAEFAPALALSLSRLAREGIQEARLQVQPPDMGPIDVRISVTGSQARVDFAADVAATRSAIEASLPQLAAGLRESGLTLAGGGVSQQPQRRHDQPESGAATAGAGHPRTDEPKPAPIAAVTRRGAVDLYA